MRQLIQEALNLAEQLAALPFKAARQAFQGTEMRHRPLGDVVQESFGIGEGLARLPFKATAAMMAEMTPTGPTLEERVAELERRVGVQAPSTPPDQTAG